MFIVVYFFYSCGIFIGIIFFHGRLILILVHLFFLLFPLTSLSPIFHVTEYVCLVG